MTLTAFVPQVPTPFRFRHGISTTSSRRRHLLMKRYDVRATLQYTNATPLLTESHSDILIIDPFAEPPILPVRPPSRPVIILPGYASDHTEYAPLADDLRARLGPESYVRVAPVRGSSWLPTLGGRPVTPILEIIDYAVQEALSSTGADSVTLVAHSAAGWISRIYLGEAPYPTLQGGRVWGGAKHVDTLMCLGSPHSSAEPVTKKNMMFVNEKYPGPFEQGVRYVNFAGDGCSLPEEQFGESFMFWRDDWFARLSYKLTDQHARGKPVQGDGVVPVRIAFLENAHKNVLLKGVWHSPASKGPWYGHPRVVQVWSSFLA